MAQLKDLIVNGDSRFIGKLHASIITEGGTSLVDKYAPKSHTHSAYVNQNAFSNIKVGSTTVAADNATDTLELVAGTNVTLTPDATNDKITITAKDTTYTGANGVTISGTTISNSGVRSIATGTANGTISVNTGGTTANVAVKGLGSAAYATKGAAGGVAELDSTGKVPAAQLPSYVDDVIEGYLNSGKFYTTRGGSSGSYTYSGEITGETGKIYVELASGKTYRWSGSAYVVISETLALGETSSTAYRGDRGKIAYDHSQAAHARTDATNVAASTNGKIKINGTDTTVYTHPAYTAKSSGFYKVTVDATGHVSAATAVTKADITGLGIPGQDTTYNDMTGATSSAAGAHGLVPAPGAGKQTSFLRGDGTWVVPTDTKYNDATTSEHGLMTAAMVTKLNGIAEGANKYVHPSYTAKSSGLYKVTVDATGHVSAATAVTKADITALGIPAQDTTYGVATESANGLMSPTMVTKLTSVSAGASGIFTGTCSTAAATAAKEVTVDSDFALKAGVMISIKATATNTASNPTINVNGTGAKSVWYGAGVITTSSLGMVTYANRYVTYIYDGTNWVWVNWSYDSDSTYTIQSLGNGYGTCSTAADTAAKVVSISGYTLKSGGTPTIKFTYAVPANATLNITSKGAKPIFYDGAAITAGKINAGDTVTFVYDGTNYHVLSIMNKAIKEYVHPTYTAKTSGLYKVTVDSTGHVSATTAVAKSDITALGIPAQDTTYNDATTSTHGLMTAAMVTKLNGIAENANAYSHPTHTAKSSGFYKVTVDGLGHVSAVTAVTKADITGLGIPAQDTTYSDMTGATASAAGTHGLVPAPAAGKQASFLRGDGTWAVPTDTKYNVVTTSANGLMSPTMLTKLNGIAENANNYSHPTYTNRASGLYKITVDGTGHVSAVTAVAKSDITALGIPGQDTTYSDATTSAHGLMTAAMVTKLNGIAEGANKYTHPSYTARNSGLYKITVDASGHVSAVTAVTKADITALGIPGQDTNTDTKVTNTLGATTKAYVTGTTSATTNTGTQVFDTGVYLSTEAGRLETGSVTIGATASAAGKCAFVYDPTNECVNFVFS